MKLIVNLKLNPTPEQAKPLKLTLERANTACNWISEQGFTTKTLKQYNLHKLTYHPAKERFELSAQMLVRCIAKVADAYKVNKEKLATFKRHGSIAYDDRILTFKKSDTVSIWTLEGRQMIAFQCGEYQRKLLPFRKGETDLIYRGGNFYLNAVCDVETPPVIDSDDVIGCDFGIVNICTTSDAEVMSGEAIENSRRTYTHRRRNLQRKQTKSAKRKLRHLAGKQARFQRNENHCISKSLVLNAKGTQRGIAIEDLKHIRERVTVRKAQRAKLSNWSFNQLKNFLDYKSKLYGVTLYTVDARNTSRMCSGCGYTDKLNRTSQDKFLCKSCGYAANADHNAARNIRVRAIVNKPNEQIAQGIGSKDSGASRTPLGCGS